MKPDDLWNDTLDEALPPGFTGPSLAAMQKVGRRRQQRRQWISTSGAALFLLLSVFLFFKVSPRTPTQVTTATPLTAPPAPVHYLSDSELIARLQEADIGVAVAGSGDDKKLLLISHKGAVYEP